MARHFVGSARAAPHRVIVSMQPHFWGPTSVFDPWVTAAPPTESGRQPACQSKLASSLSISDWSMAWAGNCGPFNRSSSLVGTGLDADAADETLM